MWLSMSASAVVDARVVPPPRAATCDVSSSVEPARSANATAAPLNDAAGANGDVAASDGTQIGDRRLTNWAFFVVGVSGLVRGSRAVW